MRQKDRENVKIISKRCLSEPVSALKNVGPRRRALLNRLGVYTVGDLIAYYPRDYLDRSGVAAPSGVKAGETNTVVATVSKPAENAVVNGRVVTTLTLTDGKGELDIVWYSQPYMKHAFNKGDEAAFTGVVAEKSRRLRMTAPDYEKIGAGEPLSFGGIIPVYATTAGLTQKLIRGLVRSVLNDMAEGLPELLPDTLRERHGLCGKAFAVRNIHFPDSGESFFQARRRLVFEELLVMQAALLKMKGALKQPSLFPLGNPDASGLLALLPFEMTGAQRRALEDIREDLRSGCVMNRLVQGDVGSGKTAVALAAVAMVVSAGAQAALMAPTEVLARQHYEKCATLLARLGVEVRLLAGSMGSAEKRAVRGSLSDGTCRLVIGTHAVIQDKVAFHNLQLVITDEQHRFGVRQRAELAGKGRSPHVLVMSATPIPRTLALILYGDMDVSVIDELPPGREKVDTFAVDSGYRKRLFAFLDKEAAAGRQAFVVCPNIEDDGKRNTQAVLTYVENLRAALPHRAVEHLHGKLAAKEKEAVMSRFARGEIDVLVSTTVIEVGVDVPNATVMIVENAERFGLSQLHQLRGRVGRGRAKAICVLVTDSKEDVCRARMKAMTETNDGFVLSERDLNLRGPGDFFGVRQHGLPELRIANLYRDMDIVKEARLCAAGLLAEDPGFAKPENGPLAAAVAAFFGEQVKKIDL